MNQRGWWLRIVVPALVVAVLATLGAKLLLHPRTKGTTLAVDAVARRDIALTIEATGTVEPIDLVEVKSKASGQILRMPVSVGSVVHAGDLLAQIDAFTVKNQYDQSVAALHAAQAKSDISRAQKQRSDSLFAQGVITADEHEAAILDLANSEAALVKARTDMATSKLSFEDATVRAPVGGTILEQLVTVGQVISSATASVSGGTALLHMADLSRIRLQALVSETDIGSVHAGETASVTVDAYPNRTFAGSVEKIEPEAVVQQSVTLFPVLISISNEQGLLLPGMNGEVSMLIDQRNNALSVPVDAVRTVRELPAVAAALGLQPDSVKAQVQRQIDQRAAERAAKFGAHGDSSMAGAGAAGGAWRGGGANGARRGAWSADSSGRRRGAGGAMGGAGGFQGAGRGGAGGFQGAGRGGAGGFQGAGGAGGGGMSGAGGGMNGTGRGSRAQVVFVSGPNGIEPRVVRLGLTNFDYAEVLDGVKEGEQVALLSVAELLAKRRQDQSALRQRMSGGMPGVGGGGGGGGRAPGGGR
jgi:HlyD family secretion protein